MGDVIMLSERREARRRRGAGQRRERSRAQFFFDLSCPFTYLAVERVERAFDDVTWTPASTAALRRSCLAADPAGADAVRRAAEERAAALRMPLVWPERFPAEVPAAMRVAVLAADAGRGAAFVLAATRLAFCGGFDLDDPEILAEAAAAAGVVLDDCLRAARDEGRDGEIEAAGRALLAAGADRLPALRVGRALYWGERRVGDALYAARVARVAAT
jgi:2-hydroxychromene-2-carboxylate isomerase